MVFMVFMVFYGFMVKTDITAYQDLVLVWLGCGKNFLEVPWEYLGSSEETRKSQKQELTNN